MDLELHFIRKLDTQVWVDYVFYAEGTVRIFLQGPLVLLRPILFKVNLVPHQPSPLLQSCLRFIDVLKTVDHRLEKLRQGISCLSSQSDPDTIKQLLGRRLHQLASWHRYYHLASFNVLAFSRNQDPPLDANTPVDTTALTSILSFLEERSHFRVERSTFLTLQLGQDGQSGFFLTKTVPLAGNVCSIFLGFFDVSKTKRRELVATLKSSFSGATSTHFEVSERPLLQMLELRDEIEKEKLKAKWQRTKAEDQKEGLALLIQSALYSDPRPASYFSIVPYPCLSRSLFFVDEQVYCFEKETLAYQFLRVLLERRTTADGFLCLDLRSKRRWVLIRELQMVCPPGAMSGDTTPSRKVEQRVSGGKRVALESTIEAEKRGCQVRIKVKVLLERQSGFFSLEGQTLNSKNYFEQRVAPYFREHDGALRTQMLSFYLVVVQCLHNKLNRPRKTFKFPKVYSLSSGTPSDSLLPLWLETVLAKRRTDLHSIHSSELDVPPSHSQDSLRQLFDQAEHKADSQIPLLFLLPQCSKEDLQDWFIHAEPFLRNIHRLLLQALSDFTDLTQSASLPPEDRDFVYLAKFLSTSQIFLLKFPSFELFSRRAYKLFSLRKPLDLHILLRTFSLEALRSQEHPSIFPKPTQNKPRAQSDDKPLYAKPLVALQRGRSRSEHGHSRQAKPDSDLLLPGPPLPQQEEDKEPELEYRWVCLEEEERLHLQEAGEFEEVQGTEVLCQRFVRHCAERVEFAQMGVLVEAMQIPCKTLPSFQDNLNACSSVQLYFNLSDLQGGLIRLHQPSTRASFTRNLFSQIRSLLQYHHSSDNYLLHEAQFGVPTPKTTLLDSPSLSTYVQRPLQADEAYDGPFPSSSPDSRVVVQCLLKHLDHKGRIIRSLPFLQAEETSILSVASSSSSYDLGDGQEGEWISDAYYAEPDEEQHDGRVLLCFEFFFAPQFFSFQEASESSHFHVYEKPVMLRYVEDAFTSWVDHQVSEDLAGVLEDDEPPVIRLDPYLVDEFAYDKFRLQEKIPVVVKLGDSGRRMKVPFSVRESIFQIVRKAQSVLNHESLSLCCLGQALPQNTAPFVKARFAALLDTHSERHISSLDGLQATSKRFQDLFCQQVSQSPAFSNSLHDQNSLVCELAHGALGECRALALFRFLETGDQQSALESNLHVPSLFFADVDQLDEVCLAFSRLVRSLLLRTKKNLHALYIYETRRLPPGPASLQFQAISDAKDEGQFTFYLQEKLLFPVEAVLLLQEALNFLYSKLALRFGLQDSSKFLVLQSWKKTVYFLRIDSHVTSSHSELPEAQECPLSPTLSVSFYGLLPPSSDFLGDFQSYIASQISHLTMLKVATKLQEQPSNHSLLQIVHGGLHRSLSLISPALPSSFSPPLLQTFLLQNLSRFFQISDFATLDPSDQGAPFLLYNYNVLRFNRQLHKVLLPGVALIRFKFSPSPSSSSSSNQTPLTSHIDKSLKWSSSSEDSNEKPPPFIYQVFSLGNLHWENLQILLQKAFTQALLEYSYEVSASSPEQRSQIFLRLLEWGAPSSLISAPYGLPTPPLPSTLNLLCAIFLIMHHFPAEKGVAASSSFFLPCKLVLTVFQEDKSACFVFEQVERFDALYERLSQILQFDRVAGPGKNYRIAVSFGDYLPEKEVYAPSEKFPRRQNYEPPETESRALNLLKFYLPFREGETETPRKFELLVLLENNTLSMQAYNLQSEVLHKIEERAVAIVNWARIKAYQRRSIALHNLGLPVLSPIFKPETKPILASRFQSQEKLAQRFSVLQNADARSALGKEQVGDTSRLVLPLLKRRETSNRSEAESPPRQQRNPPKLGRGVLDIRRFYRQRKEMERQREEEEKRRKQEERATALPKDQKQTLEELKTFAFLPNALKRLEELNWSKLAQTIRADSPGEHFLPRKTGWLEASNELLILQFARYFDLTQVYGRRKANERVDLQRVGALLRLAKFSFHKQYQAEERKLGRLLTSIPFHQSNRNSDLAHFLKSRSRLIANLLVPFFLRPPRTRATQTATFGDATADVQASHRLEEFWIAEYSKFLYKRITPKSLYFVERQRGARSRKPSFAPESFIKVDSVEDNLIHQIESAAGIDPQIQIPEGGERMPRVSTAAEMRIRVSGPDIGPSGGSAQMLSAQKKMGERLLPLDQQHGGRMLQRQFLKVFENTIFLIELVYDGHFEIRVYQADSLLLTLLPPRLLFEHQLPLCLTSPVAPQTRPFLALLREGFRFDSFNYDLVLEKAARSLLSSHLQIDMTWMLGSCLNFYRQAPRYARNLLFFKAVDLALSSALPFVQPEAVLFFRTECVTRFGYSLHAPSGFLFKTLLGRDSATPEVAFLISDSPSEKLHRSVFRPPPVRLLQTEQQEPQDQEVKDALRAASPTSPFLGLAHHSHGEPGMLYDQGDTFAPRFYAESSSGAPSFPGSRKVSQEEKPLLAEKVILMFKVLEEGESDIAQEFQLQSEIERIGGEGRALRLRYFLLFLNDAAPEKMSSNKQAAETSNSQRFPTERIAQMAIYVEQILTSTFGALKDSFERSKVWGTFATFPKLSYSAYQEISFVSNVRTLSRFDPFFLRLSQLRPSVQFWRYMRVRFRGRCSEFTSQPRSSYVRPHFYNTEAGSFESNASIQTAPEFTVLFPGELHVLGVAFFASSQSDFFVVLETVETNRKQIEGRLVRKIGVAQDVQLTAEQTELLQEVRNSLLYYLWLKSTTSSGEKFLESLKRHTKQLQ